MSAGTRDVCRPVTAHAAGSCAQTIPLNINAGRCSDGDGEGAAGIVGLTDDDSGSSGAQTASMRAPPTVRLRGRGGLAPPAVLSKTKAVACFTYTVL